jgi:hypothetical protein
MRGLGWWGAGAIGLSDDCDQATVVVGSRRRGNPGATLAPLRRGFFMASDKATVRRSVSGLPPLDVQQQRFCKKQDQRGNQQHEARTVCQARPQLLGRHEPWSEDCHESCNRNEAEREGHCRVSSLPIAITSGRVDLALRSRSEAKGYSPSNPGFGFLLSLEAQNAILATVIPVELGVPRLAVLGLDD